MEFWIDQPKLLFHSNYIHEIWMYERMNMNQKLNAMPRLIIALSLLGYICFNRSLFIVMGLIMLGAIVMIYKRKNVFEGMTDTTTKVLPNNPLNNVLMTDYKENPKLLPNHPEYTEKLEDTINQSALTSILKQNTDNKDIQKGFVSSRDKFEFEQSMRPFFTNPVNSVDQIEYGDFLKYCFGKLPCDKPLKIY
jgi:hypothetical protein